MYILPWQGKIFRFTLFKLLEKAFGQLPPPLSLSDHYLPSINFYQTVPSPRKVKKKKKWLSTEKKKFFLFKKNKKKKQHFLTFLCVLCLGKHIKIRHKLWSTANENATWECNWISLVGFKGICPWFATSFNYFPHIKYFYSRPVYHSKTE